MWNDTNISERVKFIWIYKWYLLQYWSGFVLMGSEKKILGFQKTSADSCKNFSRNFDSPSTLKSGIEKRCLSS